MSVASPSRNPLEEQTNRARMDAGASKPEGHGAEDNTLTAPMDVSDAAPSSTDPIAPVDEPSVSAAEAPLPMETAEEAPAAASSSAEPTTTGEDSGPASASGAASSEVAEADSAVGQTSMVDETESQSAEAAYFGADIVAAQTEGAEEMEKVLQADDAARAAAHDGEKVAPNMLRGSDVSGDSVEAKKKQLDLLLSKAQQYSNFIINAQAESEKAAAADAAAASPDASEPSRKKQKKEKKSKGRASGEAEKDIGRAGEQMQQRQVRARPRAPAARKDMRVMISPPPLAIVVRSGAWLRGGGARAATGRAAAQPLKRVQTEGLPARGPALALHAVRERPLGHPRGRCDLVTLPLTRVLPLHSSRRARASDSVSPLP